MQNSISAGQGFTSEGKNPSPLPSEEYVPKAMPTILRTRDLTATYLVVVFFIVNAATAAQGGPAAFTYLLIGAVAFFLPCAIATAQLGHMFPHEGSLYNWTHRTLGKYWSFFIGFCAWFPGIFVIIAGSDIVISLLQGLHSNWLTEPWQQGVVIICIIILSTIISLQRTRTVQHMTNIATILIGLVVLLIGMAGLVWFLTGHHSMTNFGDTSGWLVSWQNPSHSNINLFGLITLAYLGTEVPLNMGGEITQRKVASRHILWGTLLALVGYLIATFTLLTVRGSNVGTFDLVTAVNVTLGPAWGDITVICMAVFFLTVPVVYNCAFARLLMVAGIDQRITSHMAMLNKNRVPANGIRFQAIAASIIALISFCVVPYVLNLGNPADLSTEVYNICQAGATLVWAISTAFLFVNLGILYFRDKQQFRRQLIIPMPILVLSSIIGPIACLLAIIDTLFNSWIPQISNTNWLYIIGGVTILCIMVAAIGSMLVSSEANYENFLS
jgi:amino acid transporter